MQSIESLKSSIQSDIEFCDKEVRDAAAKSHYRYKMSAELGSTIPAFGEFEAADDEGREEIRGIVNRAYDKAIGHVDYFMALANADMTQPAKADDVATVTLALNRKNISEKELNALYDRYGSNYQLARAIRERGFQDGKFIGERALEYYPDDAKQILGGLYSRYRKGSPRPASILADDTVMQLEHRDMFGKLW